MVVHGAKGSNQYWMRKEYMEKRNKYLLDSSNATDDEKEVYDIEFPDGGGRTDPEVYVRKPRNITEGKKEPKKFDIRKYPRYGY